MNAISLGPFGEDEFKFTFDQDGQLIDVQFLFDRKRNLLDKVDEGDVLWLEERERQKPKGMDPMTMAKAKAEDDM